MATQFFMSFGTKLVPFGIFLVFVRGNRDVLGLKQFNHTNLKTMQITEPG